MIYIINVEVVFESKSLKNKFGEKVILKEYSDTIMTEKEAKLYKEMIIDECILKFGKRFDNESDLRKSNYEVMFTTLTS